MPNPENIEKHKFKPGHPKVGGIKKGGMHMKTLFKKCLEEDVIIIRNKKKIKIKKGEMLTNSVVMKGIKDGSIRVFELACEVVDGDQKSPNIEIHNNVQVDARDYTAESVLTELKQLNESIANNKSCDSKRET